MLMDDDGQSRLDAQAEKILGLHLLRERHLELKDSPESAKRKGEYPSEGTERLLASVATNV